MKFNHFAVVAAAMSLLAGQALAEIKIPEGTEFSMRLEEAISSPTAQTAQTGDRFTVSLEDDVNSSR